jgi:tetratricopeptide (TPR) repeat protein
MSRGSGFTPRGKVQAKGKGEMEMYLAFPRASISMFRQVHDTIGEAWAHYLLAMSLIGEDRIRADSLTRHALELMEACSPPDHAMLLSYWGLMRNNDGAVRVALEIQTEAAARAREQGLTFLLAIAWSTIGTIQWTLGDFPAALSSYVESLKHDEAIGCRDGICASENNIGCIYREMGEPGQALPHFQRSYEIAVEMNSPDRIIAGLNDIGLCDLHAGNALVALEKFSTALDRCPEVKGSLGQQGYDYRITESQRNIGLAKAALGDMQGAILAFGSSVATGDAGGLQHDAANSRIKYADVLMAASGAQLAKAGHHRDWANAMATDLYRTAADSAEARGWLPLRRDALKGLATVYELMGDRSA